jgi:hypothetical protein
MRHWDNARIAAGRSTPSPEASHKIAFKLDHSMTADHIKYTKNNKLVSGWLYFSAKLKAFVGRNAWLRSRFLSARLQFVAATTSGRVISLPESPQRASGSRKAMQKLINNSRRDDWHGLRKRIDVSSREEGHGTCAFW